MMISKLNWQHEFNQLMTEQKTVLMETLEMEEAFEEGHLSVYGLDKLELLQQLLIHLQVSMAQLVDM